RQEAEAGKFDNLPPIHTTIEMPIRFFAALKDGKRPQELPFNIRPGFEDLLDQLEIPGLIDHKAQPNNGWVAVPVKIRHAEQFVVQQKIVETFVAPMSLKALSVQEGFVA